MIIDIRQKETCVQVSYTNSKGSISLMDIPLPDGGYRNWVICDDTDPDRDPVIKNWKGESVKKVPGKKFEDLNLHEFLQVEAPEECLELLHQFNKPNTFSVDIETEITDDAMPDAETAPNRILSIQITAPNMASIVLALKKCNMDKAMEIVNEEMKKWGKKYKFIARQIVFDTEKDMLEYFCTKIRDIFHVIIGWNYKGYDNVYIKNRCKKLGINYALCSPTQELDRDGCPLHRIIIDYMELYKEQSSSEVFSLKLDNVAEHELGMHKLSYDKTLRELYRDDPDRFFAYGVIDTILVQLLHKKLNFTDLGYNMAYYCGISYKAAGKQISQTDALIFKKFWKKGVVYADPRKDYEKKSYPGAFVKEPVTHEVDFPAAYDAKSLYPSTALTLFISPDNYLGKCKKEEVNKLRKEGYVVTDRLSVYKANPDAIFQEMWRDLRTERDVYKATMFAIWQNVEAKIEEEAKRRNIQLNDE